LQGGAEQSAHKATCSFAMTPSTHLPPSSKRVKELLGSCGGMTHKDLVLQSKLSPRTVRYALKILKEKNLLVEKFNFRDARRTIYLDRAQWSSSHRHTGQQAADSGEMKVMPA